MTLTPLAQRILTAVALIVVLLPAFLFLPKWFGEALMTLFVLRAAWEWSAFPGWQATTPRLGYVALVGVLVAAAYLLVPAWVPVAPVLGISMAWWAVAFVLIVRFPVSMGRWAVCLSGLLVIVPAWICLVAILNTEGGRRLLLIFLAVVWAADVGAYFAGRRFGRVKLASLVSPGKTWEGVFGGLAAATIAAMAGAAVLGRSHPARDSARCQRGCNFHRR